MSVFDRKKSLHVVAPLLAIALVLCVGCNGLKKKRNHDLVKPLAPTSLEAKHRHQARPDERTLCIETAKTVAEKGHADEAIKLYQHAEELGPSKSPLDQQLAPLFAQAGDFDAAIERYQRLVSTSPKDTELCNNFAWTLMDAQRYSEAIAEAGRGLEIDANNKRLRTTLAMIHYRQGDRASAWDHFAKAQSATAAHHNLAVLDIDAGNVESAREHLRQASQINADDQREVNLQTKALLAALNQRDVQDRDTER